MCNFCTHSVQLQAWCNLHARGRSATNRNTRPPAGTLTTLTIFTASTTSASTCTQYMYMYMYMYIHVHVHVVHS